ncbi:MAG: hypothetical protein ABSD58_09895 [Verrucomicrobiia bacterium]|jgi:hypothetical protein
MKTRWIYCLFVAAALVGAGCNRSEETSQAPPPAPPAAPQTAVSPAATGTQTPALPPGHPNIGGMSGQSLPAGSASDAPNPQWSVPADWQPGNPSSMRRATFLVKGTDGQTAEIAVSVFPGDVGGLMANINRWRGQIGLGPVAPDEIAGITSNLDVNGTKSTVVDFKADTAPSGKTQPPRMIVVTVPNAGNSWFFKMTGDAPLVGAQKDSFLQFVKSVKF